VCPLLTISVAAELTAIEINDVLHLVADAKARDHTPALNEAAMLRLRRPHPITKHVLVSEDGTLLGVRPAGVGPEWSAGQLVVSPDHRRAGVGRQLLQR
jgi:GNAT superfamily N-acetyltransferase